MYKISILEWFKTYKDLYDHWLKRRDTCILYKDEEDAEEYLQGFSTPISVEYHKTLIFSGVEYHFLMRMALTS
jgi:hypothetical protein